MERAGGDEEHVIGLHRTVLGVDRAPFHQRQEIALHAAARDVGTVRLPRGKRHLVDLVDEDDAVGLHPLQRLAHHRLAVDQLLRLFLREQPPRLGHRQLALLRLFAERQVPEHLLEVQPHLLHALRAEDLHGGRGALLHVHLHGALVEPAGAEHAAQLLAGGLARAGQEEVEQPLLGEILGPGLHFLLLLLAHQAHSSFDQVADHRVDVFSDIADLGELRGLDLHERRAGQPRQAARDFGLPHAGGPDQDDVLGHPPRSPAESNRSS